MKFFLIFFLMVSPTAFAQYERYVDPEEPAQFPGGYKEYSKFARANFNYPPDAIEKELTGRCYVSFTVSKEGICSDFVVKKAIPDCPSCNAEALRLLKLMPPWEPAKLNGKPIESKFTLPVVFTLE
ncbi:energy transducer TonB [Fluviicola sp.]|uniref:energy transducer TonB n=1 Tax=Fluviicola sp. TaxID=1917219 RepID=UPI0031DAF77D